ncbi:S1 RNA-binding domain-containing protein [Anaerotignum sp.]|uniref:S1 RNA-binding domain-containing protein n=1 Tax=Anaerotignum sp. TaxID=2039241 RepID=UPI0028AEE489|nr:S1 RNA-binding domain-containing protein [Anaerotignum sp.]
MTKKKNELEITSLESIETLATVDDETVIVPAEHGDDSHSEDLNDLLAAMDKDPEEEMFITEEVPISGDAMLAGENISVSDNIESEPPTGEETASAESETPADLEPPKPKRSTRKKKAAEDMPAEISSKASAESNSVEEPVVPSAPPTKRAAKRKAVPILTIEAHSEAETRESMEDIIWHEIHNAYRTRKMLTGTLGGIEQTDNGKTLVIVEYKGFRIIIPLKEMMINLGRSPSGAEYDELIRRQNKILGNMLGAEIDFMIKGIDSKTRSVVASRQEAMLKKRQIFYLNTDAAGMYRIYEGRVVQARVIAVAEKVVRVEVFGVECSILARDLAWDWIGDAHERFSVGDQILVHVLSVKRESLEDISIMADVKSVSEDQTHENLKKCKVQSKYSGKVTDVRRGVVYVRLTNGVNGVAHSCYDRRLPGKKDDVSFAVTRIDEERGVAVGIITRIIKQHL